MEDIKNREDILQMLNVEIKAMPCDKDTLQKVLESLPFKIPLGNHFILDSIWGPDLTLVAKNILEIIAGIITIGDFTFKAWKKYRQPVIENVQREILDSGRICSEEDAEKIVLKVLEMVDLKNSGMNNRKDD